MITVELRGLELVGRHGVEDEERNRDQRFLFDVWLEVGDAGRSDRIEDAVDYREVTACVRDVFAARQFSLLEAMAGAVADSLLARFPAQLVRVRVRKPDVELAAPVEYPAVTVESSR